MLQLRAKTPPGWLSAVLSDFNAFLLDHAACERKASATALQLVSHYPDRRALVDEMVALSVEELTHFQQVYSLIAARGLTLVPDRRDAYVGALLSLRRDGSEPYFLDRLLLAGIIEARGCERFGLVAEGLSEEPLRTFYLDITRSEARHQGLFVRLARTYFREADVHERLGELLDAEAEIMLAQPLRAALH